ncbi:glutamate 5-kinase [Luteimonas sp. MJ204]|uniref:glutamate 5-kinase n=1 Tax=Luteimonas sp. MJ145 TaxID=3129234 RepID=UPI0031BBA98F
MPDSDHQPHPFPEQPLPVWRRAVIKVGSSLLTDGRGNLERRNASALASLIAGFRAQGREVVLVSSGAVAAGRGLMARQRGSLVQRQALASLGQTPMLALWQGLIEHPVAQVLLSHDDMRNRRRYLNARATMQELLRIGAVPIINENDTVSVDELKLGDNDNLAAAVATLVDADMLFIATDTHGLYSGHPTRDPEARPLPRVEAITPEVMAMTAGGAGALGTGGMATKLEAASKAAAAGIDTALLCGHDRRALAALANDRLHGTLIPAHGPRLLARKLWLRHQPACGGQLRIDDGACKALAERGASLLPGGVIGVEGDFSNHALVNLVSRQGRRIGRGLVEYHASDLQRIAGRHSQEIEGLLGFDNGSAVVRRDNLVLIDQPAATTH